MTSSLRLWKIHWIFATVVLLNIALISARPIFIHQLVTVDPGGNALVKLRSVDLLTNNVQYWTQSVPTSTGSIYQLSQVFSTYGYPPAAGPSLLNNTQVTGSGNRFVYGRPSRDRATNALWDSIQFFVYDGMSNSQPGLVTFVPPDGSFVGSDFMLSNENWMIVGNKIPSLASFENYNRGSNFANYIVGTDQLVNLDRSGSIDKSLWFFQAPNKYLRNLGLSYGGYLTFTLASFAGDFSTSNGPNTPLVRLKCSSCEGPVSKGITLIYPINGPTVVGYTGGIRQFTIPLIENRGWLKDPQNSLLSWNAATQCDIIQVLSRISSMEILGDWTPGVETVALDNVLIYNRQGQLPICAMSMIDASVCTC